MKVSFILKNKNLILKHEDMNRKHNDILSFRSVRSSNIAYSWGCFLQNNKLLMTAVPPSILISFKITANENIFYSLRENVIHVYSFRYDSYI